ncbi:helix-turn-helix domain-containing protein [Lyngbya sp. PCC 8106]|uniref:helix-turn-helix domain-containing protein n=1 Tax=Lyngbya sp. (strain PCC 8106) TaxID=313612 RepID=UPI001E492D76|nr:helix-turn-helix domain-containing protein [Lyngbya sp. PCC 8106]
MIRKNLGDNNRSVTSIEQAQRLVEVGLQLRQTREHHSLSLDMVAAYTMIRRHLLQALEEGIVENLPEPVYTQGLIRRYANALGLNGEELANFFLPEPIILSLESSSWLLPLPQLRPTHLYLTYILLILGTMNGLVYLIQSSPQVQILPESRIAEVPATSTTQSVSVSANNSTPGQDQLAVQATSTSINNNKTNSPTSPVSPPAPINQTVEVGITVKDESWVLIEVDGKTEFQGILAGGSKRSWKANNELVVVAGNAGGVMVTVNNGKSQRLGEPGMVEEVIFKSNQPQPQTSNSNS